MGNKGKQATKAQKEQRIKEIMQKQMEGASRHELLEFIGTWGLQRSQADNLIKEATERFVSINANSMEENLAFVLNNYIELLKQAKQDKDSGSAISVLKEIAKLKGLGSTTIHHTIDDKRPLEELAPDELLEMLKEVKDDSNSSTDQHD